jgi:hypothetical protein
LAHGIVAAVAPIRAIIVLFLLRSEGDLFKAAAFAAGAIIEAAIVDGRALSAGKLNLVEKASGTWAVLWYNSRRDAKSGNIHPRLGREALWH